MDHDLTWFFPELAGGEEQGLNNEGIETFKQSRQLARETVQNIGDAWTPEAAHKGAPAVAEFELITVAPADFPGRERFIQIITACLDYVKTRFPKDAQEENGLRFFTNALKSLQEPVPVLRIGDYNTTGLYGADDDPSGPFWRLLRGQGVSTMQGPGGGTYGIGQRAPFARSTLRTVFYHSVPKHGEPVFIGKSILSSFRDPALKGRLTQAKGWWCEVPGKGHDWRSLRDPKRFAPFAERKEHGTDIYIFGFDDEDWRHHVERSVVENFFAAIADGRLEVRTKESGVTRALTSENLDSELPRIVDEADKKRAGESKEDFRKTIESTVYYHKALRTPIPGSPFKAIIQNLGEVQLHVARDPDATERVCYMRSPRIVVWHRTNRSLSNYNAVFLCDTKEGNEYLAKMEDPSHLVWHPDQARNWSKGQRKEGAETLRQLRRFIDDKLKELRGAGHEPVQEVPSLGEFLPVAEEGQHESYGASGAQASTPVPEEVGPYASPPNQKPTVVVLGEPRARGMPRTETGPEGEDLADTQGGESSGGQGEPDPRKPGGKGGAGEQSALRPSQLRVRAYPEGGGARHYKFIVTALEDCSGLLRVRAAGEDQLYPVDVARVSDATTGQSVPFAGEWLGPLTLKNKERLVLHVEVSTSLPLAFEVG